MRPENIEQARAARKKGAIWSAVYHVLFQLAATVLPGMLLWFWEDMPLGLHILSVVLIVMCLIPILPILVALSRRLKEIEGGEEDDARMY